MDEMENSTHGTEEDHSVNVAPSAPDAVALVREFALRSHTDVVPDLVTGDTVADVLASVEVARAAYRRVAESVKAVETLSAPASSPAPTVPAGDAVPYVIDPDRLPPGELIRRGLNERERR